MQNVQSSVVKYSKEMNKDTEREREVITKPQLKYHTSIIIYTHIQNIYIYTYIYIYIGTGRTYFCVHMCTFFACVCVKLSVTFSKQIKKQEKKQLFYIETEYFMKKKKKTLSVECECDSRQSLSFRRF